MKQASLQMFMFIFIYIFFDQSLLSAFLSSDVRAYKECPNSALFEGLKICLAEQYFEKKR